ncbi:MAG: ChaN family lipoprotein [Pseudomonadota bacterium]
MFAFTPTAARIGMRAIGFAAAAILAALPARAHEVCAPVGEWTLPGSGRIAAPEILARAAKAQVALLGEAHENADHHRWELHTVAALAALQPKLVLGFEMFPRRVQAALERWVAGSLSEEEFLKASDWSQVWGYDAAFYLPLFHFARLNRIPMVALNVERDFVRAVGAKGLAALPPEKREGVSDPAAASEAYLARLFDAYAQHPERKASAAARSDPEFRRFVEAQLVWDRAMAQALAEAAARNPDALIVGVMGSKHIAHGDGVPHQLESLGVKRIVSLLPWDAGADCSDFSAGLATAVFALPDAQLAPAAPAPPLLGIQIEAIADGIRVLALTPGGIAEATGLQAEDVLTEAAGKAVKTTGELKAIVVRVAPGTWLPLKAKRKGQPIELTAKFPATK